MFSILKRLFMSATSYEINKKMCPIVLPKGPPSCGLTLKEIT